jgi:hypothetical protein
VDNFMRARAKIFSSLDALHCRCAHLRALFARNRWPKELFTLQKVFVGFSFQDVCVVVSRIEEEARSSDEEDKTALGQNGPRGGVEGARPRARNA